MRFLFRVATVTVVLSLAGCGTDDGAATAELGMDEDTAVDAPEVGDDATDDEPGIGEPAELNVAAADRIEIREGGRAWPTSGRPEAWEEADVVAELTDPAELDAVVAALDDARNIDLGEIAYELAPPDYQVGFFHGDELVERLGYYERVSAWGEHGTDGRWVTENWDLLAVTEALPAID